MTYDVDTAIIPTVAGHEYVSGADVGAKGTTVSAGFAGAVYEAWKALNDFTFSWALCPVHPIRFNMLATTHGDKTFNTDKYTFNVDDDAPNSFDNEWTDERCLVGSLRA